MRINNINTFPKLIILDRDGVINYDSNAYIKSVGEWVPIPGSLAAIAELNRQGYQVVVATNQSGIGRGLFDLVTLEQIHQKFIHELAKVGGKISGIFYCPHTPDDHCNCRKPQTGLLLQIAMQFHTDLQGVEFVGDSIRDVQAALTVGCYPILVGSGKTNLDDYRQNSLFKNVPYFADLASFVKEKSLYA